jgi:hypothetical protein
VFIVSPPTRLAILAELIDTDNVLDALTCALFQSSFIPATNTTRAELDAAEADFSNYAAFSPVVWTGPFMDANNTAYILGGLIEFPAAAASPFVPNTIGGYYLFETTNLKGWERLTDPSTGLPTPIPIEDENDVALIIPRFSFGQ